MTLTAYMADLRHDYGGVLSTDCMPLNIGYMKAVIDRDLPAGEVDTRLFAYPGDLLDAMREQTPQVLMVSNYVWNESLSLSMCRRAKRANPAVLTVMGGPNINIEAARQVEFVQAHPELDVYVLAEGDFVARDILAGFLASDALASALLADPLPSCVQRCPDGEVIRTEATNGRINVNEIPSPWLTGVMDVFFDNRMSPIIETNRGCPFQCSFCVQGSSCRAKVDHFDLERVKEEIDYIVRKIHTRSPDVGTLRIADANYGMYERDVDISECIGRAQRDYGWPAFIDATTGKNRADRIIRSMEKLNGALTLYQAVQSLDEQVLRNVRRSNIKLEAYEKMQVYVRGRGLRSTSDLILGLPGESMETHLGALHKLVDAGTNQVHCFQAMLLKGSDLETMQMRGTFTFESRFRVLPKNYGVYEGETVFDIEEIVVATDTLPFEDYIKCRMEHLAFSVFWNDSWFDDAVQLAGQFGIAPSQWLVAMLEAMMADRGEVRQLLDDFIDETRNELFASYEACAAFYAEVGNFQRLCRGEIGDNLMYKYRAKASFFLWQQVCRCAMAATRRMLEDRGVADGMDGFSDFWRDFHAYVAAKHASGTSVENMTTAVVVAMRYDIARWIADGMPKDLAAYHDEREQHYVFELTEEGAHELQAALKVWTAELTGLTKLVTRIRVGSQVRACRWLPDDPQSGATN